MIRVLHMIGGLDVGGSQSLIMNIYRKIDKGKMQFDFIIDCSEHTFYVEEIEALGGRVYEMPKLSGVNILRVQSAWNVFFEKHSEYKILHSHVRSYASVYLPIARKHGLTTIIHSHNTSNGVSVTALAKTVLQYPLRFQADYFMACSVGAGKWLFGKNVVKRNNFFILANGIESKKYIFSTEKRKKIRKELNIPENAFVIGFLARVVHQKNPLFVIEVFKALLERNGSENYKLLFVGDGDLLNSVQSYAKSCNLSNYVIFTGQRTDTAEMMMAMDVYLFPSLWEGLGITLIEAQATGLTSICSENIQDEAVISNLVFKLLLSMGADKWADFIASKKWNHYERDVLNMYDVIQATGYDIEKTANWLFEFYMKLALCK